MKEEESLLNLRWPLPYFARSTPAPPSSTAVPTGGFARSSSSATKESKKRGVRPSFYLAASMLTLGVSGWMLLPKRAQLDDYEMLLAKGWEFTDSMNCPGLEPGSYFTVESENASAEGYYGPDGRWMASALPLPEAPATCRKITQPTFIQEVK